MSENTDFCFSVFSVLLKIPFHFVVKNTDGHNFLFFSLHSLTPFNPFAAAILCIRVLLFLIFWERDHRSTHPIFISYPSLHRKHKRHFVNTADFQPFFKKAVFQTNLGKHGKQGYWVIEYLYCTIFFMSCTSWFQSVGMEAAIRGDQ